MVRFLILIASFFFASSIWASTLVNLQFFTHTQMKMPEQDVFIESPENSKQVVRTEADVAAKPGTLKNMVYATATATVRDPFKTGALPLGPFPKGKPLGFTLGEWLAASGSGTYVANDDANDLNLNFEKLVPHGVYTVWCSRLTFPPNVAMVDKPCVPDGAQNTFKTDANGNGTIHIKLPSPLAESTKEEVTAIVLVYHSDGRPHSDTPGDFGLTSHVQLVSFLPTSEVAPETVTKSPSDTVNSWWLAVIGLAGLGIGAWWVKKRTLPGVDEE